MQTVRKCVILLVQVKRKLWLNLAENSRRIRGQLPLNFFGKELARYLLVDLIGISTSVARNDGDFFQNSRTGNVPPIVDVEMLARVCGVGIIKMDS